MKPYYKLLSAFEYSVYVVAKKKSYIIITIIVYKNISNNLDIVFCIWPSFRAQILHPLYLTVSQSVCPRCSRCCLAGGGGGQYYGATDRPGRQGSSPPIGLVLLQLLLLFLSIIIGR